MQKLPNFIARHGLWSADQQRLADDLKQRMAADQLRFVRLVWCDPHGYARAKLVSVPVALSAFENGYNINVATSTLDAAGARIFSSFTPGGGMGIDEMTGSPNLVIVPDPATYRTLPWAPGVGWMLCDEHFRSGTPFHFSPRHLLKRQAARLQQRGLALRVGLEVEWYLLRVTQQELGPENIGYPGMRGRPIATAAPEPGYHYHSESNMDLMQPVLSALGEAYEGIGLPLRSIENEWGPGQVECTFAPADAVDAADNMLLFRSATRQLCRRLGYFATFMARPAIKGYYASGWHLHQSLVARADGGNLMLPDNPGQPLSDTGLAYVGGLLGHAAPSTVFATPTINGYRRLRPNSLAPDRATWAHDHRGVMIRALGGYGDRATRLENRIGEPAANPYLFIASQIIAGLAGIDQAIDPGPQDLEPYAADRPLLPTTLPAALQALQGDALFASALGPVFLDYYLRLKRNEVGRFEAFLKERGQQVGDDPTEWEHNEYFDFF